jgi:hypothetical protein
MRPTLALLVLAWIGPLSCGAAPSSPAAPATSPSPRAEGLTDADYAREAEAARGKMPQGFTLVLEKPFIVVGDEAPAVVRQRSVHTVRWAVDRLKADYFSKDPADIITVWLFKDKASYEKHAAELFGDRPHTPYGYYSPAHRALVMNIATGGGTLVHEIVHPFIHANFPACPPWLNEGLGSLYEQCIDRNGHIAGLTNWRLAGLKEAIQKRSLPSFENLCAMNGGGFYGANQGIHYAQARYLCYYLQERGLLTKFYADFVANQKADPTGLATLKKTLGEEDMAAFKKRWETWALGLTFP